MVYYRNYAFIDFNEDNLLVFDNGMILI